MMSSDSQYAMFSMLMLVRHLLSSLSSSCGFLGLGSLLRGDIRAIDVLDLWDSTWDTIWVYDEPPAALQHADGNLRNLTYSLGPLVDLARRSCLSTRRP